MAFSALGVAVASFGVAALLIHARFGGPVALGLAWIGVFGAAWMPISFWTTRRALLAGTSGRADSVAVQAQFQIEYFRSTRRDALTGLPSRAAFAEMLAGLVSNGKPVALLVFDLDDFWAG